MKLTPKQQKFADFYIQTGNSTESAIRAGYSKNTACEMGYENLRKPHILNYVNERNESLESSRIADMKEIKEFWTRIVRGEELDRDEETLLAKDRLKASELIAKTNGAFLDRVEHSGVVEINIDIEEDDSNE